MERNPDQEGTNSNVWSSSQKGNESPEASSGRSKKNKRKKKNRAIAERIAPVVETEVQIGEERMIWDRATIDQMHRQQQASPESAATKEDEDPKKNKRKKKNRKKQQAVAQADQAQPADESAKPDRNDEVTPLAEQAETSEVEDKKPESEADVDDEQEPIPEPLQNFIDMLNPSSRKASAKQAKVERAENLDDTDAGDQPEIAVASPPPPVPPDISKYRRAFWEEADVWSPAEHAANHTALPLVEELEQAQAQTIDAEPMAAAYERPIATPDAVPTQEAPEYRSGDTPDRRAAFFWLGWFMGRHRGKKLGRRAAEKAAAKATKRQSERAPANPPLEAVPLHQGMQPEASPDRPIYIENQNLARSPEASFVERRAVTPDRHAVAPERRTMAPERPSVVVASKKEGPKPAPSVKEVVAKHHEESLQLSEAVKLAKNIRVGGVKLSEVFMAKRIDEAGLLAVVQTYMRGGDVKRKLTEEIINKEMSFERDPELRHKSSGQVNTVLANTSEHVVRKSVQLSQNSQKALRNASRSLATGAARAQYELIDSSDSSHWIGITAIVIIYSLILILILA